MKLHQLQALVGVVEHGSIRAAARALFVTQPAATRSLRQTYQAALLIACAHPAALTAREITFVAAFAERFAGQIDAPSPQAPDGVASFWFDPLRDQPPAPLARRAPRCFCTRGKVWSSRRRMNGKLLSSRSRTL